MSKNITTAQKSEIAADEVKTRTLLTITMNNEAQDVIRILENDVINSFTYNGNPYISAMVKRGTIESKMDGGPQKLSITISNINKAYSAIIAEQGDVLTNSSCVVEEVIYYGKSTLTSESGNGLLNEEDTLLVTELSDTILEPCVRIFDGKINNVRLTETVFKFDVERILGGYSTVSPNTTYDISCQWQFKDERCQYSGGETTCDKTLSACQTRENSARFGGYPSIPSELVIRG